MPEHLPPRDDLLDRQALRRVPGLGTELEDITEVEYRQVRLERVVLVGVWTAGTVEDAERSLAELARLAETAGSVICDGLIQRRDKPDPATYVGAGKVRELRDVVVAVGADTVICDGELAPGQLRLQHVRRVGRALRLAGSHDGVQLVDEEDDLALGGLDLLEDGLEPLLELAAVLRPGHHRREVQRDQPLALE